jgi:uroporphyrinogen-III synthase
VVSLRPVGGHDGLRRAAAREGARTIALSPWKLETLDDTDVRRALRAALASPCVVFTSPAAVRASASLQALRSRRGQRVLAVGATTARALRRTGIDAIAPERMDSDGLLALPQLRDVRGIDVGLVTAPGGRDRLAPVLSRRGARVLRADVYRRVPVMPSTAAFARLRAQRGDGWLALSSGEALRLALATWPDEVVEALHRLPVAAASARLATLARETGWRDVRLAASARPGDLIAAMAAD